MGIRPFAGVTTTAYHTQPMEFAVSDIHFKNLQKRLGHSHKDDPKKLP